MLTMRFGRHDQPPAEPTPPGGLVPIAVGIAIGLFVAFLFRPAAPLVGQLPLMVVLTRGAKLQGLDLLLVPIAQRSFNYLVAFGILGGVAGFLYFRFATVRKPSE
jgi:hypothetical protein